MKKINLILCLFITGAKMVAQNCGMENIEQQIKTLYPLYNKAVDKINYMALCKTADYYSNIKRIPVVYHIIHDNKPIGTKENIANEKIRELNAKLNWIFRNVSLVSFDTHLEFCLAGINRVNSSLGNNVNSFDRFGSILSLKNLSRLDPRHFLNIWVVDTIDGGSTSGFAEFPGSPEFGQQYGVVVVDDIFVNNDPDNTLAHEVGHCFGLFHTCMKAGPFSCLNNDCRISGDDVCDTPPCIFTYYCDQTYNTCTTDISQYSPFTSDVNDMIENIMGYNQHLGDCRAKFTNGQADRMHFMLEKFLPELYSLEDNNFTLVFFNVTGPANPTCNSSGICFALLGTSEFDGYEVSYEITNTAGQVILSSNGYQPISIDPISIDTGFMCINIKTLAAAQYNYTQQPGIKPSLLWAHLPNIFLLLDFRFYYALSP